MPQMTMPLDFGFAKDPKNYMKNRESAIKTLMEFFPMLWNPEFTSGFYGVITLALQESKRDHDLYITMRRATSDELAYGYRSDHYSKILLTSPYDMLPILANEVGVLDGNHRMNAYRSVGLAPLILQVINRPQQGEEAILVAQYDDSVRERKVLEPQRFQRMMEEQAEMDEYAKRSKEREKELEYNDEEEEEEKDGVKKASKNKKLPLSVVKKLPYKSLNRMIKKMREYLKNDGVVQEMFKEYGVDIEEIDLIPMRFGNLDVSAKTDHGVIIYNYKLLCDGDFFKDFSYGVHEMTHWLQQTTGDKPTKSSDDGDYLDNPFEQEGFQNQIEYIAKQFGEDEAENYVDDLLEHHDIESKKEYKSKKKTLMSKV